MEIENNTPDISQKKINRNEERLKGAREKMEIEAHIFIEATKQFTSEWIRREVEVALLSPDNESSPDNLTSDNEKLNKLKADLQKLPIIIPGIVEANINNDEYWIHRSPLPRAGISQDYFEFKKEKMRRELTARIRMILGCASEVFGDLKEEEPENKIWVKERGRRKYACFLRFSDEMTASLNRYFEKFEELFVLNHEMKEETAGKNEKKIG